VPEREKVIEDGFKDAADADKPKEMSMDTKRARYE